MTAEQEYDAAVSAALGHALTSDQLYLDALDQWADSGQWYEPPAYQRDFQNVSEVSGYVGEGLLLLLERMRRATR